MRSIVVLCLCFPLLAQNPPINEQKDTTPKKADAVQYDPAVIVSAETLEEISSDMRSSAVVRAQILLDRNHFSPAEIDGRLGTTSQIALRGYQSARSIPVTGVVDAATWKMLNADKAPVLVAYNITDDDLMGPFDPIPSDIYKQAEMKTLNYQSPQEMFGEKFHISPQLLKALNPGTDFWESGAPMLVPNVKREFPPPKAAKVIVTKSTKTVTAYLADGTIIAQYPATIGSSHDPLPIGDWDVVEVSRNPVYHYNPKLFWDANPNGERAVLRPGPNSPVGLVWVGLSKPHYGIHGTPRPGLIGHTASHGCVRLTNWDVLELAQAVQKGTPVMMRE